MPRESRISVIIPVLNGEQFISQALDSVWAQSPRPTEAIVIDDGSSDRTPTILKARSEPLTILTSQKLGPAGARNKGLKIARGDLITFLDADDLWPEDKLSRQIKELNDHPEADISLGMIKDLPLPGAEKKTFRFRLPDNTLYSYYLGAGLYHRRVFDKVGFFDESLRYCEDVDLFLRCQEDGVNIRLADFVTLIYRRHAGNMSRGMGLGDVGLQRVLKMSLDRRRRKGSKAGSLRQLTEPAANTNDSE